MSELTPTAPPLRALRTEEWRELVGVARPATRSVLIAVLAGGLVVDLALRAGVIGLAGALAVVVASVALIACGMFRQVANPQALAMAVAAPLFGVWLAVRTSPSLIPFDVLAAAGLLCLAASYARGGSILDLTVPGFVVRATHALAHGVLAPAFALEPLRRGRDRARLAAAARGALIAIPVLVITGVLLGSADAVFASFFHINVGLRETTLHVVLIGFGAWAMAGLLRVASSDAAPGIKSPIVQLGTLEAGIVLGALDLLFGAFAVAQLVATSHGGQRVLSTAGLTYAQYARSGFFQLIAVALITFIVLVAVRGATASQPRTAVCTGLALTAIALTLVIVGVAVHRLGLYEHVFGLTVLRYAVTVVAWWIAGVFALLAIAFLGVGGRRQWLVPAVVASALATLLVLNVVNPEAVVARHDVARAFSGRRFDAGYLAALTDDAVPTLVAALPRLTPDQRAELATALRAHQCLPEAAKGWAAANLDQHRSRAALRRLCAPTP